MKKIKPGIYRDFPVTDYYADPAPSPSLTQSLAKIIIERSPLHAWHAHPRLNPDFERDDPTKYDVGNIAHALMIGRGKDIVPLEQFDDWRSNAAKDLREKARTEGKLAVLGKHYHLAEQMTQAAHVQLAARGGTEAFRNGHGEVVTIWNEKPFGHGSNFIWLRQMIDWLTADQLTFFDYKTTGESAAPHVLGRKMAADGWHIQAAMAERGLACLHREGVGRRRFLFVVQETDPPYALNVVELGEAALTMGRKMLNYAIEAWAWCIENKTWPAYPAEIVRPEFPGWAETEWLNREVAHEELGNRNVLMAG